MKVANATLTSLDAPGKPIGAASMNLVGATNWPTDTGVIFAMRKVDASLITDVNPAGVVPNSYTEWAAQLAGVTLSNLTLVYGNDQDYSEGLATQVFVPLSGTWADRMISALLLEHKQTGTHKDVTADSIAVTGNTTVTGTNQDRGVNLETIRSELIFDHVAGNSCIISLTSGLGWAMSSGVVYINGRRLLVASSTGSVTPSKDTYFDLLDNGDGTAVLVNTGGNIVNNNATSPALGANSVRAGILVTDASTIVSGGINQGQEDRTLPIVSLVPLQVTDSLGNLICPRDPYRKLLGMRQRFAIFSTSNSVAQQIPELSVAVKVPAGRKVKVSLYSPQAGSGNAGANGEVAVWEGTIGSTRLTRGYNGNGGQAYTNPLAERVYTPGSADITFNGSYRAPAGLISDLYGDPDAPMYLKVELE